VLPKVTAGRRYREWRMFPEHVQGQRHCLIERFRLDVHGMAETVDVDL